MLKLLTNNRSPYGKRVLLCAAEIGVSLEIHSTEPNSKKILEHNPLGKIPVLYDRNTEESLAGSTYIIRHLHLITPGSTLIPESPRQAMSNAYLESISEGIIEAILLLVYEEKFRQNEGQFNSSWSNHLRLKITRGLDWLTSQTLIININHNSGATSGQITAAVAVGYAWIKSEFFNLPIPLALQNWFKIYATQKPHTQAFFPKEWITRVVGSSC
ncbi:glutathione S-transferase N-terminal domain-containing protein [Chromohalobacter salexigens]|uniref:glutathione S-transferase family protein n=1 Tax=Chromohalobacter israelensis TaxID=141390 RepID=UPI0032E8DF94